MAELGRDRKAIWAMRRALTIDREGFGYATVPSELHDRLSGLAEESLALAEQRESDDHAFLAAAIYHLSGDEKQAHHALRQISEEDAQKSTRHLRQLVSESEY